MTGETTWPWALGMFVLTYLMLLGGFLLGFTLINAWWNRRYRG